MTARTNTCLWCGRTFPTPTAHMIHLHDDHPETMGRGRTMSREWTCEGCGAGNRPVTHRCHACGRSSTKVLESNLARTFTVNVRLVAGGAVAVSAPTDYVDARAHVMRAAAYPGGTYDERRHEAWVGDRRIAWLEVAVVTAGTRYIPPPRTA